LLPNLLLEPFPFLPPIFPIGPFPFPLSPFLLPSGFVTLIPLALVPFALVPLFTAAPLPFPRRIGLDSFSLKISSVYFAFLFTCSTLL
jgi:hypothetical protein